jgi:hypothetical protein
MVRPAFSLILRSAFAAAMLSLALPVEATLYKWVDQKGNVTYSNMPPPAEAEVRELQTIGDNREPTATELRTREILEEAAREHRAMPEPAGMPATRSRGVSTGYTDLDNSGIRYQWVPQGARPALASPLPDNVRYPPSTPITVRDPCLVSPDPRCYELNAANYDPYRGYAPMQAGIASALGATRSAAGGTAGATSVAPTQHDPGTPIRNVANSTVTPTVAPAAQAASQTTRSFRGLPPGTPVLPISR